MITRGNALLVSEGLRSLVEVDTDGLGKSPEIVSLFADIKSKFLVPIQNWMAGLIVCQPLSLFLWFLWLFS